MSIVIDAVAYDIMEIINFENLPDFYLYIEMAQVSAARNWLRSFNWGPVVW